MTKRLMTLLYGSIRVKPACNYRVNHLDFGEVFGVELTSDVGENVYELTRIYYHHKHTSTFCCTFFHAKS